MTVMPAMNPLSPSLPSPVTPRQRRSYNESTCKPTASKHVRAESSNRCITVLEYGLLGGLFHVRLRYHLLKSMGTGSERLASLRLLFDGKPVKTVVAPVDNDTVELRALVPDSSRHPASRVKLTICAALDGLEVDRVDIGIFDMDQLYESPSQEGAPQKRCPKRVNCRGAEGNDTACEPSPKRLSKSTEPQSAPASRVKLTDNACGNMVTKLVIEGDISSLKSGW
ncbi:uncharacterized protein EI90DRAFT_3053781 [Cantharellus anzutake]|uniref:uncharacterized protein n=1 Tax=Cantharellus anzutake TaxID=1750568 RepID=UPI0019052994|nr:uncharacterized protein EI90DRAFT_3053781 [Cantharellus anzutake]KAF8332620.1 hypothetical protein EI90DRAFT_3053781 [Cantharellus anzutake]